MEFTILDFSQQIDSDTILKVIEENHRTAKLMETEVKKLKQLSENHGEKKEIDDEPIPIRNLESEKETEVEVENIEEDMFEDEIDYYNSLLKSISENDLLEKQILDSLPTNTAINYQTIIRRLQLELIKEINTIKEFIYENEAEMELEDLKDFKEEVQLNQRKLDILRKVLAESEEIEKESVRNNFFFATTTSGNIRALDEATKIAKNNPDHCEIVLNLFQSIENGTFKNVKRFSTTNNKTMAVSEVRGFQGRVIFDRIGQHDYAIITTFIKKSDNDKGYLESIELRIKKYLNQRESIIKNLDNDEYRELNKNYTEELYRILGYENNKDKSLIKEGEKNVR